MTNTDRIEALEAVTGKIVEALLLADPVAAARLFASDVAEAVQAADDAAATELAAPVEATEPEPDAAA
jgi:hypothetical protein